MLQSPLFLRVLIALVAALIVWGVTLLSKPKQVVFVPARFSAPSENQPIPVRIPDPLPVFTSQILDARAQIAKTGLIIGNVSQALEAGIEQNSPLQWQEIASSYSGSARLLNGSALYNPHLFIAPEIIPNDVNPEDSKRQSEILCHTVTFIGGVPRAEAQCLVFGARVQQQDDNSFNVLDGGVPVHFSSWNAREAGFSQVSIVSESSPGCFIPALLRAPSQIIALFGDNGLSNPTLLPDQRRNGVLREIPDLSVRLIRFPATARFFLWREGRNTADHLPDLIFDLFFELGDR